MDDLNKLQTIAWPSIYQGLDNQGYSVINRLLPPHLCRSLAGLYDNNLLFRSHGVSRICSGQRIPWALSFMMLNNGMNLI